jgi:hypothetical protein
MKTHHLKCWPEYFKHMADLSKNFELRKDDRGFEVGDKIVLHEWNCAYTGNKLEFEILYILRDASRFGLIDGYCILSLMPIK